MATDGGGYVNEKYDGSNCRMAEFFQRSQDDVGINRSAWGWSVKCLEQPQGLDNVLKI